MQALEHEPTIINPAASRGRTPNLHTRILKPVAGMAIAASVAAVLIALFRS
jgi:hypothetical protein